MPIVWIHAFEQTCSLSFSYFVKISVNRPGSQKAIMLCSSGEYSHFKIIRQDTIAYHNWCFNIRFTKINRRTLVFSLPKNWFCELQSLLCVLGFDKSEISLFCVKIFFRIPVTAFLPWADATETQLVFGCKFVLVPWLIDSVFIGAYNPALCSS